MGQLHVCADEKGEIEGKNLSWNKQREFKFLYYVNAQEKKHLKQCDRKCIENNKEYLIWNGGLNIIKCTYKNNKLEGECIEYHPNGNIWVQGTFIKGKQNGIFKYWDNDGTLWKIVQYKRNKTNGEYRTFRNDDSNYSKVDTTEPEWKYFIDAKSDWKSEWRDLKYHVHSWKFLTKLIDNKKKRRIMKRMFENKNKFYSLQNDNIIFVIIMEYIGYDEMKLILEKLSSPNSFFSSSRRKKELVGALNFPQEN